MKVRRIDTAKDELSGNHPAAYCFLTGDRRFFDEHLDFFNHLDLAGMEPNRMTGCFFYDNITIEKVRELWDAEYKKKAEKAGIRPMAHFYFDRGKTCRQSFQAWYFRGCQNMADRRARYKTLNAGGKS